MTKSQAYVSGAIALILVAVFSFFVGSAFHSAGNQASALPGGVVPGQLFTANTSNNSVSPVSGLPNIFTNGSVSAGGVTQYNQTQALWTASSSPASVVTLGPFGSTTSTATSSFSIVANATTSVYVSNLRVGDPCEGGASTSTVVVDGCSITAVGNGSATGTLSYGNLTGAALAVPTSTVFRVKISDLPY